MSRPAIFIGLISLVLGQNSEYDDGCFDHEELPNPSECCTRPMWINQYLLRPCRYTNLEVEGYRGNDHDACMASCGVYRINMTLFNNRVETVRVFKPKRLRNGVDPQWRQVMANALGLCKTKIRRVIGRQVQEDRVLEECEHASGIFEDCLNSEMFLYCPTRSWIKNEGCDRSKRHLMKGCPFKSLADVVMQDSDDRDTRGDGGGNPNEEFEPVDYQNEPRRDSRSSGNYEQSTSRNNDNINGTGGGTNGGTNDGSTVGQRSYETTTRSY